MEIAYKKHRIILNHTFGISRSKNDWYDRIIIYFKKENIIGIGEVAPSIRYNETIELVEKVLRSNLKLPSHLSSVNEISKYLHPQLMGLKSLEMGLNMAIWDWKGKINKSPIYELIGSNNYKMPLTSYTIAIGDLTDIATKVKEAKKYSILKVKLGKKGKNKQIIKEVRNHTNKLIRVDANEAWDLGYALEMCKWLADYNVEFIEQPFPADKLDQTYLLKKKSPIEIFADENSISSLDIPNIKHAFDGINIKLMKCGSFEEAIRMVKLAKLNKMKIMIGCMVETSVGITAASHLAAFADYVDLDGNLLIKNDPFIGVKVVKGALKLPVGDGIGVALKKEYKELEL
tara:strand:- start:633 stop:1667 length:1035 start_codon:yes stop_codon:yes gene_type:complete